MAKICIISETAYPFRNDATAKIVYNLAHSFSSLNDEVTVFTKSFCFKNRFVKTNNSIKYVVTKSNQIFKYHFLEVRHLYKNFFCKSVAVVSLFFSKLFSKIGKRKITNKSFFKTWSKYVGNQQFDLIVLACGNYGLCKFVADERISAKRKVLYALDYWGKNSVYNDAIQSTCNKFDAIYGQASYPNGLKSFKNQYVIWRPLVQNDQVVPSQNAKGKVKLSYFGGLYDVRDYRKFLSILNVLADEQKEVNIYDFKTKLKKEYHNVCFKKVAFDESYSMAKSNSDILLILDNKKEFEQFIPSKIYESMQSQKPVIFFYDNDDSFALKEISKYSNLLTVNINKSIDECIKLINEFCSIIKHHNCDFNFYQTFPECDGINFVKRVKEDCDLN